MGVPQWLKYLLCRHEVLSSNPQHPQYKISYGTKYETIFSVPGSWRWLVSETELLRDNFLKQKVASDSVLHTHESIKCTHVYI